MSNDTRHPLDISRMLGDCYGDPAFNVCNTTILMTVQSLVLTLLLQNFIPNLKDYAICKILGLEHDTDNISFTEADGNFHQK